MTTAALERLLDEAALRRCAELYARGADRRDKALWRDVLSAECKITGPGFNIKGLEANLGSIDHLGEMFRGTLHRIHNQVVEIDGDRAAGETCCTADHLLKDSDQVLRWSIRYQDEWRREAGQWRFIARALIVDWEELVPVTPKGEQP